MWAREENVVMRDRKQLLHSCGHFDVLFARVNVPFRAQVKEVSSPCALQPCRWTRSLWVGVNDVYKRR